MKGHQCVDCGRADFPGPPRRGMCSSCHQRMRLAERGLPVPPRKFKTLKDRFWAKVDKSDECWIWMAAKTPLGYGRFNAGEGRSIFAHRTAYELAVGTIPDGLVLDHLCRVPSCVNPAHLEPVTNAENTRRGMAAQANLQRVAAMTHCKRGHARTDANLKPRPDGSGYICRPCVVIRSHERHIEDGYDCRCLERWAHLLFEAAAS